MPGTSIQEDLDDIYSRLETYYESSVGSDLIIARENSGNGEDDSPEDYYQFGRVNTDEATQRRLIDLLKKSVQSKKDDLEDDEKEIEGEEFEFSNKNRDKDLIQYLEFSEITHHNRFEQLQDYEFDSEDSFEKKTGIKFIIICVRDPDDDTVTAAFQTFSKSRILSVDDRVIISKISQTITDDDEPTYESNFEETLYDIPQRIDALYHDEQVYVFNQNRFERIFDYYDEFDSAAQSIVTDLTSDVDINIEGMPHFEKAIKDFPHLKRRLYDVKNNIEKAREEEDAEPIVDVLDQGTLQYLDENFESDVIVRENGDYQIELEDRFDSWGLVKVLNDAYLESDVTDSEYVANSKSRSDN